MSAFLAADWHANTINTLDALPAEYARRLADAINSVRPTDQQKDANEKLRSIDDSLKELVRLQSGAAPAPEKKEASWMSHKSG